MTKFIQIGNAVYAVNELISVVMVENGINDRIRIEVTTRGEKQSTALISGPNINEEYFHDLAKELCTLA